MCRDLAGRRPVGSRGDAHRAVVADVEGESSTASNGRIVVELVRMSRTAAASTVQTTRARWGDASPSSFSPCSWAASSAAARARLGELIGLLGVVDAPIPVQGQAVPAVRVGVDPLDLGPAVGPVADHDGTKGHDHVGTVPRDRHLFAGVDPAGDGGVVGDQRGDGLGGEPRGLPHVGEAVTHLHLGGVRAGRLRRLPPRW